MPAANVNTHQLRFSFDMGTNSIGWAVYDVGCPPRAQPLKLRGLGATVHDDGREKKRFTTLKSQRGGFRRGGRMTQRRARRLRALARALAKLNLLPPREQALQPGVTASAPVNLREQGLDHPLSPHELGRVLMHLARHRGYKSNRRSADNREDGRKISKGIEGLRGHIEDLKCRTLGEYLARQLRETGTCRFRTLAEAYPTRDMVEAEFDKLRVAQTPHHPNISASDWSRLRRILFHQRPLRPPVAGRCRFVDEPRAPMALPSTQRARYLATLVNLRLIEPDDHSSVGTPLSPGQVNTLADLCERQADVTPAAMRRAIGQSSRRFTVERGPTSLKKMPGNRTSCTMRRVLGDAWDAMPEPEQDALVEVLLDDDEEAVYAALTGRGFDHDTAGRLLWDVALEPGNHGFGRTVVNAIVPRLREGTGLSAALVDAGFEERPVEVLVDRLPYYGAVLKGYTLPVRGTAVTDDEARFGRIGNDSVHIALNRLRRLFNALVDCYGTPDEVVLETTRQLNASNKERLDERKRQDERREENARLDEDIRNAIGEEAFRRGDRRILRRRAMLHERQRGRCLYSDRPISLKAALDGAVTDIDHVLPWSATLDDSLSNLVLVFAGENRARKKAATPWQAFADDPEKRQCILDRAEALCAEGRLPRDLVRRLGPDGPELLEKRDWLGRQLPETGYIARVARLYLSAVVPAQRILLVSGSLTAQIRRGLDITKSRADHRHHALDAAVVGLVSRRLLQQFATASGRGVPLPEVLAPWPDFADELRDRLDEVTTAPRVDRKQYRSLQPDYTGAPEPLHDILPVRREGGHPVVVTGTDGLPRIADRFRNTHRLILHRREDGVLLYKAVKGNANAYVEIYRTRDGRLGSEVVSTFDASRLHPAPDGRMRPFQPRWVREEKGARLVMRLFGGDPVATGRGTDRRLWRVEQIVNAAGGAALRLVDINCASPYKDAPAGRGRKMNLSAADRNQLRLVHVDVLGRVRDGERAPHRQAS